MTATRQGYDGVVVTTPTSVPYQRFSTETAHWWAGAALRGLAEGSGISHRDMDGLSLASFGMAPDSAIGHALAAASLKCIDPE